jgi:hypothetical protein
MSTRTTTPRATTTRARKPAAHERPSRRDARASIVDLTRVVEARRRIASGWYDRSDVRQSLVEAVLEEMRGR